MKKLFITTLIVFAGVSAFAQFEKGRILAGGSLSFSSSTNKTKTDNATSTNYKQTDFSFDPKVGYFFIDHLAAGLGLDLSTSSRKDEGSSDKDITSGVSISPFVRYYIDPGIYFQGQFGGGSAKDKNENGNTTVTTKYGLTTWSVGAGYAYFLNSNVAIEPFVGYGSKIYKDKSSDTKSVNPTLFINIGLQVYLDRK